MASTFVVEDGSGVAGANSYASEADADTFFDNAGESIAWDAVTPSKEQRLRNGTAYLDRMFGGRWRGRRAASANPLDWPRTGVDDDSGYLLSSTALPQGLVNACFWAAYLGLTATTLEPDITDAGTITRITKKVGPLEKTVEYSGGMNQHVTRTIIEREVRELIRASGGVLERG